MADKSEGSKITSGASVSRRQLLIRIASIAITLVLLAYLVGRVNWTDFDQLLARVAPSGWIGALLAYLALNLFRALRFRILLDRRDSPWRILIPITLYHNFLVRALPFKLGELSYIFLLRSRLKYSMEEGVSSLVGARILELLIIIMVFASSILASAEQLADHRDELLLAIAVTFIASVVALYYGGAVIRTMLEALRPANQAEEKRQARFASGVYARLHHLAAELDRIRQLPLFLAALFTTCFTYTSSFLTNYILLRALGVDVELPAFIAIISLGMFGSAFPFTVSGFGVVEGAWLLGLTQFAAMSNADAAATGFLLHGFQIAAAALYGLLGYLLIHFSPPLPVDSDLADQL
jgi:hypothetical protein